MTLESSFDVVTQANVPRTARRMMSSQLLLHFEVSADTNSIAGRGFPSCWKWEDFKDLGFRVFEFRFLGLRVLGCRVECLCSFGVFGSKF